MPTYKEYFKYIAVVFSLIGLITCTFASGYGHHFDLWFAYPAGFTAGIFAACSIASVINVLGGFD